MPPLHRTLVESHLQYLVRDTTPLFACMQAIGLGHARELAYYFDTAAVLTATADVRHEIMGNKDVCGVPYPLEKKRGPTGNSAGSKKNVYGHVGHRDFNNDHGSIPGIFRKELEERIAEEKAKEDEKKRIQTEMIEHRRMMFVANRFDDSSKGLGFLRRDTELEAEGKAMYNEGRSLVDTKIAPDGTFH